MQPKASDLRLALKQRRRWPVSGNGAEQERFLTFQARKYEKVLALHNVITQVSLLCIMP